MQFEMFIISIILVILLPLGLYTLGFVIPKQLKEILVELKSIKTLLKENKSKE